MIYLNRNNVKVGMIICLNHWPYKPLEIMSIEKNRGPCLRFLEEKKLNGNFWDWDWFDDQKYVERKSVCEYVGFDREGMYDR